MCLGCSLPALYPKEPPQISWQLFTELRWRNVKLWEQAAVSVLYRKVNYALRARQSKDKVWPLYLHICFSSHSKGDSLLKTSGNWSAFWRMWRRSSAAQEPQQDSVTLALGSAVKIKVFREESVLFWISTLWSSALKVPYLLLTPFNKEGFNEVFHVYPTLFLLVEHITYLEIS